MKKGIFLLIVGIAALIFVYSFRPPSGLGDAFMMMGQGRDAFLKEPAYLGLMAISSIVSLFGVIFIVKGMKKS